MAHIYLIEFEAKLLKLINRHLKKIYLFSNIVYNFIKLDLEDSERVIKYILFSSKYVFYSYKCISEFVEFNVKYYFQEEIDSIHWIFFCICNDYKNELTAIDHETNIYNKYVSYWKFI